VPEGDDWFALPHATGPRPSLPHGVDNELGLARKTAWRRSRFTVGAMFYSCPWLAFNYSSGPVSLVLIGSEVRTAALWARFAVDVRVDVFLQVADDVCRYSR
jgi:hypothetical protein